MNITELARILKITPQELRNYLPKLGFDIGQKAIKINKSEANKIIKDWPTLRRKIEEQKLAEIIEEKEKVLEKNSEKIVEIGRFITVREFSAVTGMPINALMSELMKNGIFSSLNEKIDFDTAWLIGQAVGIEIKQKEIDEEITGDENKLKNILALEKKESMLERPPVIVVMGHVDHGKTKLLDAIRKTDVVAGEAGGITQHIGAYQVIRNNRPITFIDTPGHEAFTAMRSRGAKIADIAILVVAADDGVMPQTIEAYRIIEAAKIPFVVAMNKIDKPEANIDKTKQELSNKLNILPEDWGGKIICVPISAISGAGVTELLDMVLLLSETEAENIKANPDAQASGTVIESHIDKGAGPIATILIQNGTLRVGDQLTFNNIIMGKARCLYNYKGEKIDSADPSTPTQIIGFKNLPQVGDILQVGEGEKVKKIENFKRPEFKQEIADKKDDEENTKKINIVIKSDVLGSAEAIEESLEKLNCAEVNIKIIHKGLGNISEGDIKNAEAANAHIIGFNVKVPPQIEELAREKNIKITIYRVIYNLINDLKEQMQTMMSPTIRRVDLGKLNVLGVFKSEKTSQIIGGKIISGRAEADSLIEVMRGQEIIARGKLARLQAGKQDVKSADAGQECGIQFEGSPVIAKGDTLQIYKEEKIIKKL
jgi:translation initiation factor IF-2